MADVVEVQTVEAAGRAGRGFDRPKAGVTKIFAKTQHRRVSLNLGRVDPGEASDGHRHDWDQVNYVLSGEGLLRTGEESATEIRAGMAIYIYPGEMHRFENTGDKPLIVLGFLGPVPGSA